MANHANNSDEVAISVKNISKYFEPSRGHQTIKSSLTSFFSRKGEKSDKGYLAVDNVSFEVKKGEFFGIVGRNGSGKSTLLKMIAGVYTPTSGGIGINGKLVPFIELGVGFNAELSGRDNVFLNGAILGFTRKEMETMYEEIVTFAELRDHMDVKLKNFSSGMQVRLAFSIAIRADADVLLIDEVLAVGDAAFQQKCFEYFGQIKMAEKTVIFVSHDMESITKYCDRVLMISGGTISCLGKPQEIANEYRKANFEFNDEELPNNARKVLKSQPVNINKIRVKRSILNRGSDLNVFIDISSRIDKNIHVALSVLSETTYLGGVNSTSKFESIFVKSGLTKMHCRINTNSIGAGRYKIGYAVFDAPGFVIIDQSINGPAFQILDKTSHKDGFVNLEAEWTIAPTT